MFINQTLFAYIILSLSIISVAFAVLIIFYFDLIKKLKHVAKEKSELKIHEDQRVMDILEKARRKASRIITDANFRDEKLENIFKEESERSIIKQIDIFREEAAYFLEEYKKHLKEIRAKGLRSVEKMSKSIEEVTHKELRDFKEIVKQETFASQKIIEEKIEKEYKSAEEELATYKEKQIKKIENSIYEIIHKVSELVLGKGLSLEQHQELILQALDKAKEEEILKR